MTAHRVDGPVLVVGCGLIGTSVALALSDLGTDVHLRDLTPATAEVAAQLGAGTVDPVDAPRIVVVAVPPASTAATVLALLEEFPTAVVTDVASVKSDIAAGVTGHPGAARYVGGHPMAGTERSGPMAAAPRLFEGRPWAVVPHADSTDDAVGRLTGLATAVGAVPMTMTPQAHDRAVALVSHVPHVVSVLTAGLLASAPRSHLDLAGPGLRDVTRVAGSETGLWLDILGSNAGEVREVLTMLRGDLDRVLDALDAGGPTLSGRLADVLDAGRAGTRRIPGKHGDRAREHAVVHVQIADRPGELSRLMTHAGESDVNIEDIRIDHEYGRPVGLVEVEVAEDRADHLVRSLTARGWSAYR
ncbi:prephenate dehydrogenase [Aeromicrobium marinum DSM 15272]|uniref:Prephenate dehydrogenase n=1 Tax=Aeromicrobium marinum DSM 15272 TaxID=585531 RepID=E2S9M9_9ACTN|nr:prephenate dehydrogenase [Aeromicrobium marinum]EFQ83953.1 prephenate dehydrogenase [Aeromicrobium marinum DSM 15272]